MRLLLDTTRGLILLSDNPFNFDNELSLLASFWNISFWKPSPVFVVITVLVTKPLTSGVYFYQLFFSNFCIKNSSSH